VGSGAFVRSLDRKRHPIPLVSLCLSAVTTLLFLFPSAAGALEYNRPAIVSGQIWRLATGHLVHYSFDHFFWDTLTLGVLAVVCERRNQLRFCTCAIVSAASISLAMWFWAPSIYRYRGLSGVDSAVFALVAGELFSEGIRSATRMHVAIAAACLTGFVLKSVFELTTGQTVFVTSLGFGAVGVPLAHLVGAATGVVIAFGSWSPLLKLLFRILKGGKNALLGFVLHFAPDQSTGEAGEAIRSTAADIHKPEPAPARRIG
jgi:rhomboid family GlyGly-CTERM serine protease